jgi:hypothetical protein
MPVNHSTVVKTSTSTNALTTRCTSVWLILVRMPTRSRCSSSRACSPDTLARSVASVSSSSFTSAERMTPPKMR